MPATKETGTISVNTENLFPIIKKWLYSEHDIFLRELISNAVDAITKHRHLALTSESKHKDIKHQIDIALDKEKKTLTITDTGLGMDAEEVKKYIAQIALSSANDFVEKFKDAGESDQIIGHFGMGFYSAYMVAERVTLESLSYKDGAEAVRWECDGTTTYTLDASEKDTVGTSITLHLDKDSEQYADDWPVRQIIEKYWDYAPYPLNLNEERINIHKPIWSDTPSQLEDKDYTEFYSRLNPTGGEPLFWVHINFDLPLNLKGILYFPKFNADTMLNKGKIRLFCNQVFVTDETQELIPPFLEMLHGVIDWPDMPLNVSRSALQNSPEVRKIAARITKKVADKLNGLYKTEKDKYIEYWSDLHPLVKYGALHDKEFFERIEDIILFKSSKDDDYTCIKDYLERAKEAGHENKVYYASDANSQKSYIDLFKSENKEVLYMDHVIDSHFLQFMEFSGKGITFQRIDSELDENLLEGDGKSTVTDENDQTLDDRLVKVFGEALGNTKVTVESKALKSADVPALVILPEHQRRFNDMQVLSGQGNGARNFIDEYTLVVNSASPVAEKLLTLQKANKADEVNLVCEHVHDLALIAQNNFDPTQMSSFVERSNRIIGILAGN